MKILLETGISPNQKFIGAELVKVLPNGNYVVDIDGTLSTITTGFFNIGPVLDTPKNRRLVTEIKWCQNWITTYVNTIGISQNMLKRINLKEFKNENS